MSYPAMAWARKVKTGSATNKSVLLAVANYADENGECWPSQERLAEDTELSRRSIVRALDDLEKAGHLVRERRHRPDGSRKSDLIKLSLSDSVSFRGASLSATAPNLSDTVSKPKCHSVTAEPSIEPSIEPSKKDILSDPAIDADFNEFWAAYPKRVNNPKKSAKAKYVAIRKRGVQHDEIMAGTKAYAIFRQRDIEQGGHQKYTKMAEHWLNGECWTNDYSIPDDNTKPAPKAAAPVASDEQMAVITEVYKGPSGDLDRAKANLAAELVKGVGLEEIITAAKKHALYVKQMRQNGMDMAMPTLETWIKFKWREMDAYEIYRNPVERHPVLRPIRDKRK